MILIGDAGGTTTNWRAIADGKIHQLKTRGLNLAHDRATQYMEEVSEDLLPYQEAGEVHFYVSGLTNDPADRQAVVAAFSVFFKNADILVENDVLAAARGLCGHQPGWAGILGTGANLTYFDGDKLIRKIPSLGYVLGDEGSAAFMGKRLLTDFLRGEMPSAFADTFARRFQLDEKAILMQSYQSDSPKSFFASFSQFIHQHIRNPYCYRLVYESFQTHFDVFYKNPVAGDSVHYTGSVAFYFSNILRQVASDRQILIGHITESPLAGLTLYHQKTEK
ncbi:MAG: N-acetylglucosamine kinase [Cyclobacteriaceae bacterium]|nr:N-acetylglucosamine kinase [Cyclobacteriaceae bacterium]